MPPPAKKMIDRAQATTILTRTTAVDFQRTLKGVSDEVDL